MKEKLINSRELAFQWLKKASIFLNKNFGAVTDVDRDKLHTLTEEAEQYAENPSKITEFIKKAKEVHVEYTKLVKGLQNNEGAIEIRNVPYGFFEKEMRSYFSQFGVVKYSVVLRNRRTGKSKGYGLVLFEDKNVAEIAAITMDNYIISDKILKCTYIPPEKIDYKKFRMKQWSETRCPGAKRRRDEYEKLEKNLTEEEEINIIVKSYLKTKKRLDELESLTGIRVNVPLNLPSFARKALKEQEQKIRIKKEVETKVEAKEDPDSAAVGKKTNCEDLHLAQIISSGSKQRYFREQIK